MSICRSIRMASFRRGRRFIRRAARSDEPPRPSTPTGSRGPRQRSGLEYRSGFDPGRTAFRPGLTVPWYNSTQSTHTVRALSTGAGANGTLLAEGDLNDHRDHPRATAPTATGRGSSGAGRPGTACDESPGCATSRRETCSGEPAHECRARGGRGPNPRDSRSGQRLLRPSFANLGGQRFVCDSLGNHVFMCL